MRRFCQGNWVTRLVLTRWSVYFGTHDGKLSSHKHTAHRVHKLLITTQSPLRERWTDRWDAQTVSGTDTCGEGSRLWQSAARGVCARMQAFAHRIYSMFQAGGGGGRVGKCWTGGGGVGRWGVRFSRLVEPLAFSRLAHTHTYGRTQRRTCTHVRTKRSFKVQSEDTLFCTLSSLSGLLIPYH